MSESFLKNLKKLLADVLAAEPEFYRKKYLNAVIDDDCIRNLDEERFKTLPAATKEEIARAPYAGRLYQEGSGITKLIPCVEAGRSFLLHRTLEEIKEDDLPYEGARPMVLMSNMYEAIERCLFFYERNILPLIGEFRNPAVAVSSARQYNIDALVMDHTAVLQYRRMLCALNLNIQSVTVVDSTFHKDDFSGWPPETTKYFVVSFPETGRLAYSCPRAAAEDKLVLHPYPDVYIEPSALSVITSVRFKSCPMIRYRAPVYFEDVRSVCGCGKASFAL